MEDIQKRQVMNMAKRFFPEKKELTATIVNLVVAKMFFTYPRVMVLTSGNAAWIQMIYATLLSFLIFLAISKIMKNSEGQNIFQMAEKVGGAPFRIIIGIVVMIVLISTLASEIRVFSESVGMVLLPNTSTKLIMLVFIGTISIGAYIGINSIWRIHSIFMPIIAVVLLFFLIVLIPDMDLNNIFPIMGTGTQNIFLKGTESTYVFADIMTIYIIIPFCKNKSDVEKSTKYAFFISGAVSVAVIATYTLVYPYPVSEAFVIPSYQLARMANVGFYFQRFEAFFEFCWSIAMMLYAAYYLYIICYSFAETFRLKYRREVILPIVLFAASLGFLNTDLVSFLADKYAISKTIYPLLYIIPAAVGILYNIKIKRGHK